MFLFVDFLRGGVTMGGEVTEMSDFKVGTKVVHVERYGGSGHREICRGTIVRETRTMWVDDAGMQYSKVTLASVPQYIDNSRYIVTLEEWDKVTP